MAENVTILKAVANQWNHSTALQAIPLRSTRIPDGAAVVFPYCLVECKVLNRKFYSGSSQVTSWLVTLYCFCGNDKTDLNTIANAIIALFDSNIALPVFDGCYVMSVRAVSEEPTTDVQDWYGVDQNLLIQQFSVTLNERRNMVHSTLAS